MKPGNTPLVSLEQSIRAIVVEVVREELAKAAPAADEYLTVREAGELIGVVPSTVRKWLRAGRLQRYNAGADPRVKRSDAERMLRSPRKPAVGSQLTPEEMARRDFG